MEKNNFIIGGGRRCGSTFLYHLLSQHPDIDMYQESDTIFFIDEQIAQRKKWLNGKVEDIWEKTPAEYFSRFNYINDKIIYGEKCADILHWTRSHRRLYNINPDMKIILQLRNPVHRAWSQYNEEVRKGRECILFNDAIADEEHRINSSDYAKYHLSYLKGGDYFDLVQSLLQFFSKDQILILIFEDTINDYHNATDKICNFLNIRDGIDINNSTLYKNKNKDYLVKRKLFNSKFFNPIIRINDRMLNKVARTLGYEGRRRKEFNINYNRVFYKREIKQKMHHQSYDMLVDYYKHKVSKLEDLISMDLSVWEID